MTKRTAHARSICRDEERCADFDAALADYITGGDVEGLLWAASIVVGSFIPIDPVRADAITELTGCAWEIKDYDDAGRAVRGWFTSRVQGINYITPSLRRLCRC